MILSLEVQCYGCIHQINTLPKAPSLSPASNTRNIPFVPSAGPQLPPPGTPHRPLGRPKSSNLPFPPAAATATPPSFVTSPLLARLIPRPRANRSC